MPTKRNSGGDASANAKSRVSSHMEELLDGPKMRTTLLISEGIDRMVEVCAAMEGRQKSEVVNEALASYLKDKKSLRSIPRK